MKYNIVLIPGANEFNQFLINLADHITTDHEISANYLLNRNTSHPHISVFQFEISDSEPERLHAICLEVQNVWQTLLSESETTEVSGQLQANINYKQDVHGPFEGVTWGELLVDKIQSPGVVRFHQLLLTTLKKLGLNCLNAHGDRYTPHFTLFNAKISAFALESSLTTTIPEEFSALQDTMTLVPALGVANEQWELTKIVYNSNPSSLT